MIRSMTVSGNIVRRSGSRLTQACAGILVVLAAAAGAFGQTLELTPRYAKGHSFYIEHASDEQQIIVGTPGETTTVHNMHGILATVESADAGGAKLSLAFDRLGQRVSHPRMPRPIEYDSDRPTAAGEASPMGRVYRLLLGYRLAADLDAAGRARSLTGMATFLEQARGASEDERRFEQITREMADDVYRYMFLDSLRALYPDKPVKPGDAWETQVRKSSPSLGEMIVSCKIRFEKIEEQQGRKMARLAYERDIRLAPGGEPAPSQMGALTVYDGGRANGTATIDIESGRLVEMNDAETSMVKTTVAAPGSDKPVTEVTVQVVTRQRVRILSPDERRRERGGAAPARPEPTTRPAPTPATSPATRPGGD